MIKTAIENLNQAQRLLFDDEKRTAVHAGAMTLIERAKHQLEGHGLSRNPVSLSVQAGELRESWINGNLSWCIDAIENEPPAVAAALAILAFNPRANPGEPDVLHRVLRALESRIEKAGDGPDDYQIDNSEGS